MSYTSILVHFDDSPSSVKRLDAAARLAERHDAHLIALVLDLAPQLPIYVEGHIPASMIERLEERAAQATAGVTSNLEKHLARLGGRTELRVTPCHAVAVGDALALQARYADLLVLGQPSPNETAVADRPTIEEILLSSGRPALLVPYAGDVPAVGERVLIAWDAGREAARAVSDAMPLIEAATSVHVLTVNARVGQGRHGEVPGADIGLHLARHGVQVEVASVQDRVLDVGDVVLNWAADHGIDTLVMGAYAHSRIRELVLGGMTRSILDRMTIPVLMAH